GAWSRAGRGIRWAGPLACRETRREIRDRAGNRSPPRRPAYRAAPPGLPSTSRTSPPARATARERAGASLSPSARAPGRSGGAPRGSGWSASQRDVPVVLGRVLVALGREDLERLDQLPASVAGLDDFVDVPAFGGGVWIGELLAVLAGPRLAEC